MTKLLAALALVLVFAVTPAFAGGTPQADEHANPTADDNASDEGMLHALCNAA